MADHHLPLRRALRALAHPSTLAWIGVLLLNDQVLRWRHTGWLTGKLSDVAWLAVAPLAAAATIAALSARRNASQARSRPRHDAAIIWIAIGLVGALFAIVKTFPGATDAFRIAFRAVFGWTPLMVCDPTDLLTLPAMAFAWWRWEHGGPPVGSPRAPAPLRRRAGGTTGAATWRGWAALAAVALAGLGNSGPPDEGIVCLTVAPDRILAGPRYGYAYTDTFESRDGGLTWQSLGNERVDPDSAQCPDLGAGWTFEGPLPDEVLRVVTGRRIERSTDAGVTWTTVFDLAGEDARMAYYEVTRSNTSGSPGPHDAAVDPDTGNIVLAMGHEGVLVRTAPGRWQWVALGSYRYEPLRTPGQMLVLLQGELGLVIAAGFVTVAMFGWRSLATNDGGAPTIDVAEDGGGSRPGGRSIARFAWPIRVLVALAALGVALAAVVVRPATISGYGAIIAGGVVIAALAVTLVLAAVQTFLQARALPAAQRGRLLALLGWLALTVLLVMLPYLAWALGWLATYTPAAWAAVILATVVWLAAATKGGS